MTAPVPAPGIGGSAPVATKAEPEPHPFQLGTVQVTLWWARLDVPPHQLEQLRETLAPEERREGERFRHGGERFVAWRGLLRQILGRHLDVEPARLGFGRSPEGKPFLLPETCGPRLCDQAGAPAFSSSRSGAWMGVALATSGAVGLDLEVLRHDVDCSAVAEHLFAPGERAALAALSPEERRRAFFTCWVRKEACLKGMGSGLLRAPEQLDVGTAPGLAAVTSERRRWLVQNVTGPQAGYVAAIAVENILEGGMEPWPNSSRWRSGTKSPPVRGVKSS